MTRRSGLLAALSLVGTRQAHADTLDASALSSMVGYTIIAATHVAGDFEGADHDKTVKLDNGMVFEFLEYSYSYSYRPEAVVLARTFSPADLARAKVNRTTPLTIYRLIVDDEIYDVVRVR